MQNIVKLLTIKEIWTKKNVNRIRFAVIQAAAILETAAILNAVVIFSHFVRFISFHFDLQHVFTALFQHVLIILPCFQHDFLLVFTNFLFYFYLFTFWKLFLHKKLEKCPAKWKKSQFRKKSANTSLIRNLFLRFKKTNSTLVHHSNFDWSISIDFITGI